MVLGDSTARYAAFRSDAIRFCGIIRNFTYNEPHTTNASRHYDAATRKNAKGRKGGRRGGEKLVPSPAFRTPSVIPLPASRIANMISDHNRDIEDLQPLDFQFYHLSLHDHPRRANISSRRCDNPINHQPPRQNRASTHQSGIFLNIATDRRTER